MDSFGESNYSYRLVSVILVVVFHITCKVPALSVSGIQSLPRKRKYSQQREPRPILVVSVHQVNCSRFWCFRYSSNLSSHTFPNSLMRVALNPPKKEALLDTMEIASDSCADKSSTGEESVVPSSTCSTNSWELLSTILRLLASSAMRKTHTTSDLNHRINKKNTLAVSAAATAWATKNATAIGQKRKLQTQPRNPTQQCLSRIFLHLLALFVSCPERLSLETVSCTLSLKLWPHFDVGGTNTLIAACNEPNITNGVEATSTANATR